MVKYDYDAQIAELTEHPENIYMHWSNGLGLFQMTDRSSQVLKNSGCLTMIRGNGGWGAYIKGERDEELTTAIREDIRIPKNVYDITPKILPVFKEWQLKIDALENA